VIVTVLLVDDHPIIRQGLRNLIAGAGDLQVIGEAADGIEALREIELRKPDIVLIDLMMPNLNGFEVLSQVRKLSPATRPIVFSMHGAEPYVVQALRAGAQGYVLKDAGPGEVVAAIRSVMRGDRYLSEPLRSRLEASTARVEDVPLDSHDSLTTRELEVLQMTAEGRSSAEIGKILGISPRTVEIHRGNLMRKLGLRNQTALIRYAINRGILPPSQ
jgi:two-component system response regulator NreC